MTLARIVLSCRWNDHVSDEELILWLVSNSKYTEGWIDTPNGASNFHVSLCFESRIVLYGTYHFRYSRSSCRQRQRFHEALKIKTRKVFSG